MWVKDTDESSQKELFEVNQANCYKNQVKEPYTSKVNNDDTEQNYLIVMHLQGWC